MENYVEKDKVQRVLVDSVRSAMLVSLRKLSDSDLEANLRKYRANAQASAMMARSASDIYCVPLDVGSSFGGKPYKMSVFNAWNMVYHEALNEQNARLVMAEVS